MKAIMLMFDTLNRRMLSAYGYDWTHTPNFKRLAERSVLFENSYAGSMPCMPARRELHTGRYNFLHCPWGPLEPFDFSMPEALKKAGVYTHMATDHYHYFEDGGSTYHTRFNSWEFERGQEGDPWKGQVEDPVVPDNINGRATHLARQDWINRNYMKEEPQHSQARTFERGLEFIATNHDQDNWFLQLETFDPHEPFFSHQQYKDLYPHGYDGPLFDWPAYDRVRQTPEQVEHLRYEYTALLSMCDAYLGKVLDAMDEYDLWDDTMLIVNTDHGFLLGEHDWWAKIAQPFYDEVIHTPLFIWDPRSKVKNERRSSLVQTIDLPATVLDYFGVPLPDTMEGQPLKDTITQDSAVREAALFGVHGGHVNVTDGRYVYMRAPVASENQPLYAYTLMPAHMRRAYEVEELQQIDLQDPFDFTQGIKTMKIPAKGGHAFKFGTLLFDLENDPKQMNPLVDDALETRMIELMVKLMQANDAPPEQYKRLGLPADGVVKPKHLQAEKQRETALRAMEKDFSPTA